MAATTLATATATTPASATPFAAPPPSRRHACPTALRAGFRRVRVRQHIASPSGSIVVRCAWHKNHVRVSAATSAVRGFFDDRAATAKGGLLGPPTRVKPGQLQQSYTLR